MTEADWLGRDEPGQMLLFLQRQMGKRPDARRKIRLWLVACSRQFWDRVPDPRSRALIEASEQFTDGEVRPRELKAFWHAHWEALGRTSWGTRLAWEVAHRDVWPAATAIWAVLSLPYREPVLSNQMMAGLSGDLFGNPFRPAMHVLAWRTPTVVTLARGTYAERSLPSGELEPSRLGVLADVQEEAGCTDADIIDHLRGPGPHVRGCWAVDLVLANG